MFEQSGFQGLDSNLSGFRTAGTPSVLEEIRRKSEAFPKGPATLADLTNLFSCSTNRRVTMESVKKMLDVLHLDARIYMALVPNDAKLMEEALKNVPTIAHIAQMLEHESRTAEDIITFYINKMKGKH